MMNYKEKIGQYFEMVIDALRDIDQDELIRSIEIIELATLFSFVVATFYSV